MFQKVFKFFSAIESYNMHLVGVYYILSYGGRKLGWPKCLTRLTRFPLDKQ